MYFTIASVVAVLAATALANPVARKRKFTSLRGPLDCKNVKIPATVSTYNAILPSNVNKTHPLDFIFALDSSNVEFQHINKTYNLVGRYCEPSSEQTSLKGRQKTLQILSHGNTYDKNYWFGLEYSGKPAGKFSKFSWAEYALLQEGYPVLSIDRLGNGESDLPDPVAEVQLPVHIETAHAVVQFARSGKLGGRAFEKIIFVGHSYGSFVGNGLSAKYPADADAYILTGFTNQPPYVSGPGNIATSQYLPAALVDPVRFGTLPLGYLAGSSKTGRETVFYTTPKADFDEAIFELDWQTAGTVTVGEAVTGGSTQADAFRGSVYVLTGTNDAVFCGNGTGPGDCGPGSSSIAAQTGKLFPNAANFAYATPDHTGHDLNFHFTAQDSFKGAHDWLAQRGF